jgi:hypothetical protein
MVVEEAADDGTCILNNKMASIRGHRSTVMASGIPESSRNDASV